MLQNKNEFEVFIRKTKKKKEKMFRMEYPYEYKRNYSLLRNYGISGIEYSILLEKQKGVCFICGKRQKKSLAVDHCHKTGKIRGLLCDRCNRGLGFFKDSAENLLRASHYILENQ